MEALPDPQRCASCGILAGTTFALKTRYTLRRMTLKSCSSAKKSTEVRLTGIESLVPTTVAPKYSASFASRLWVRAIFRDEKSRRWPNEKYNGEATKCRQDGVESKKKAMQEVQRRQGAEEWIDSLTRGVGGGDTSLGTADERIRDGMRWFSLTGPFARPVVPSNEVDSCRRNFLFSENPIRRS